ncbi:MAG: oligosaccharide flippase family protein [Ignavibacteria bacterium]|nr:oligosaccharide flippase family protein [Ignavibacteria bacterium]
MSNLLKSIKARLFVRKQELSNSVWNIADVLILPFLMVLVTPYFIKELGTEQYGIWMLVNSIVAGIGIVNFGMGEASIKFISKFRAINDIESLNRIFKAGLALTLIVFLLILLIGNSAAFVIEKFNLFNLSNFNNSLASDTMKVGSFIFGLKQVEQYLISLFKGYERYDGASIISIISKFILLITQVVSVYLGFNLINLFIASFLSLTVVVLGELIFIRVKFKKISFLPSLDRVAVKEIFSFGIWAWVQTLLSIIAGHADRFVVISLAGPKFLAYYSLASTVGSQVHSIFSAGVSWVFPKVSGKTERREDITGLYYKLQFAIILAGSFLILLLIFFEYPIFHTWLGNETYNNSILLIKLFLFLAFFNLLSIVPYYFLLGTNLIRVSALFMFVSVIFTLGFMIAGFYLTGITGLAYGKLISSIVSIPMMLLYVHYNLIDSKKYSQGAKLYIIVFLFALSFYLLNILVVPLFIIASALLWALYKNKIKKNI